MHGLADKTKLFHEEWNSKSAFVNNASSAYGLWNFENFQNITCAHKSIAFIRFSYANLRGIKYTGPEH